MKKIKISSTYRLDELTRQRIKQIAANLGYSEAEVIEVLVNWYFRSPDTDKDPFYVNMPNAQEEQPNKKMNNGKIILDLCGGTGSWSKPYAEAGYDVRIITLPENDVFTYIPPNNVYGILAAPTCTHFSFARTNAKTPRDLENAMKLVMCCLGIIWQCQYKLETSSAMKTKLKFWALENPRGFLRFFLGNTALEFQPWKYGDGYMKLTHLWGNFKLPKKNIAEYGKIKFDHIKAEDLPQMPEAYEYDKMCGLD